MIAVAGGGTQGFSLWLQSPLPRGLTGLSPFGKMGSRISEVARGNHTLLIVFLSIGALAGLVVTSISIFAQASAAGAVGELESNRDADLHVAFRFGRSSFWRVLALTFLYLLLGALLAVPSMVLWSEFGKESGGVFFPCILGVLSGLVFVVLGILLSIVFEFSCRYVVLANMGIIGSVASAVLLMKRYFRESIMAWFSVLLITLASAFAMAVVMAAVGSPLSLLFTYIYDHHNGLLIALGLLVSILTWLIAVAVAGVFSVSASAVWTVTFMEFDTACNTRP
ncbi:MAG: hypothetical protein JXA49_01180 [Actinobacteria bacterium]|nr:hypothetical protein [Actinomycetota bacterium]